ncbi:MAG TPA: pyridoxal-dependent decarboxylase [Terriglobales bacterium]
MNTREETLDPQDWTELRELGHRMLDDMLDYLQTVRERPVWKPLPKELTQEFDKPLPVEPEGIEQAYNDFVEHVLPYPLGNIHPRFWSWVCGTGTPGGMLAEMLAAGMNSGVHGAAQSAVKVEQQVLNWCKEIMGFPASASGILVTGGSMANLVGLTVARNAKSGTDVNQHGMQSVRQPLTFYCSAQTHNSVHKAIGLLGLGRDSLREIRVNERFEIDIAALSATIEHDRRNGLRPVCVIGNAGTVNTGAVDDLNAIAEICAREDMWFHVDGAFGALISLSPALRPLISGLERADSLAFDFHKWMYTQYDAGCALIRSEKAHHESFRVPSSYLSHFERGVASGDTWFGEYGVELSRSFRALRIWMSIKEHGIDKYRRMIEQNVAQARYLVGLIKLNPELELMAPAPLNIVCFRYHPAGLEEEELDGLNKEILFQLQEQGIAAPSSTVLNGSFAIRVAISNHRSRVEDLNVLAGEVCRIGRELTHGGAVQTLQDMFCPAD